MNGYLLSTATEAETDVPVAGAVETTISDNVYLTHALIKQGDAVCLIGTTAGLNLTTISTLNMCMVQADRT